MTLEEENACLRAEHAELSALIAQLQEQRAAALARSAEREQQRRDPPPFITPTTPARSEPTPPRKQRDPRHTHVRRRAPPPRTVDHAVAHGPDGHDQVRGHRGDDTRHMIELPPPPPVEVIEERVINRVCPACRRWHRPTRDRSGQVLGRSRIGVRLASLSSLLRTTLRLPLAALQRYLRSVHQLRLSVGGMQDMLHAVAHVVQPAVDALTQQVRHSRILHGDATTWRENGVHGSIWSCSTSGDDAVRYDQYDRARAQAVVKRVLDGQCTGHLVSDFYVGSNDYAGKHQRCWVQLLRDLHALQETQVRAGDRPAWAQAVRAPDDTATRWRAVQAQAPPQEREAEYVPRTSHIHQLGLRDARETGHPCQALAKRVVRHADELFQFVLVAGVSADNNVAERA